MNFKKNIWLMLLLPLHVFAIEIYPQVSASIVNIKSVGVQVNKGDVVVQLDDRQAKLKLGSLQVLKSIKQQEFDDKQLELNQTKELYDRMVASHRDLDIAQMAFDTAKRELDAHNIRVEIEKIELEKYVITTPISGTIKLLPNYRNTTNINAPKILMVIE